MYDQRILKVKIGDILEISFSAVVLSGEVRSRIPKTVKCINSISRQTYTNVQKILINGGSPPHQTNDLIEQGANLSGWKIIDFPIDTMEAQTKGTHRWNGQAALLASTGEYFFSMNDDDFIHEDFFEKMAKLFKKYPTAISGIGLPIVYDHDSNSFSEKPLCIDSEKKPRPEFEAGIEVVRKIFFSARNQYQPCLGFQPIFKTQSVRDVSETIFSSGFPDFSSYFQVVARGDAVFDSEALMYWGKHSNQHSTKMTNRNYWQPHYAQEFKSILKINTLVFKNYLPHYKNDLKKINKFFNQLIILQTLHAIKLKIKSIAGIKNKKNIVKNQNNQEFYDKKFPWMSHFYILVTNPFSLIKWCIKKVSNKCKKTFKNWL